MRAVLETEHWICANSVFFCVVAFMLPSVNTGRA
jgi:hypothetical protein